MIDSRMQKDNWSHHTTLWIIFIFKCCLSYWP